MMEPGVEARRIFVDKASGRHFDRPQYQLLRKILSTGNIVYIDALDRMGRNYDEVISEWKYITRELQSEPFNLKQTTNKYNRRSSFKMEEWRNYCCYVYGNVRAKEKHVL